MASDSPSELSLRQLLDFPREEMATEIKEWLDLDDRLVRAKLAKELIALANHGGGYLLFGFRETTGSWQPSGPCPYNLARYSQDAINEILKRHAEPVFECFAHHLYSSAANPHVVVEVPGGHTAPIRAARSPQGSGLIDHTYYIRRPGPESAPPQSGREWEVLIRRCVDNDHERHVEAFRRILAALRAEPPLARQIAESAMGPEAVLNEWTNDSLRRLRTIDGGDADRYARGWWSCAYVVAPVSDPPSLPSLRTILRDIKGTETGWPVWLSLESRPEMEARIAESLIECWLKETDSADFWRADPNGRMFLLRTMQEDHDFANIRPGTFLDLILPVWRTGECLLHSVRMADRLGADTVSMMMRWHGLAGRELRSLAGPGRMLMPGQVCSDPEVTTHITVAAANISDTLPEVVKALVAPLYARFGFFEPADELYTSELNRMRTGMR